jgi:mRNA-degrading endonuclease YafQ of YafQ-DinJ toxin-antitoxin module
MIEIAFTPSFDRKLRKLEPMLLDSVHDAVDRLQDHKNHPKLKLHKLHGRLKGLLALSVDYRHRIVFRWINKSRILLLDFGDHSVYE